MEIQAPKGTKDMLPSDAYKWHYVENIFREISKNFGIREIRTPIFEHTELFLRGVGETTDIVQKEMYTFEDKGSRSITLKPEGTAPAVRAFIENRLFNEAQPTKLFYITPCFRYEKAQKGRYRQFHQFGIEMFGTEKPSMDAEVMALAMTVLNKIGLKGLTLNINNLGCPTCRPKYNEALKKFLEDNYDNLCPTCKTRFEKNPMRILDCKEHSCKEITKNAPIILDYICEECSDHFTKVKEYLDILGIEYNIDPGIVRGLDYYTKTIFEILNSDFTVCGGGRYDRLIEEIGGPETPAVGFGMGIERLIMAIEKEGIEIPKDPVVELYLASRGEEGAKEAFKLAHALRNIGVSSEINHAGRSFKAEMKYANKIGAKFSVVLGDDELQSKVARFKRMEDGEQFELSLNDLEKIKEVIKE
ncbi:histidine--tRNA ligase [Clostridium sardiniense]|uniref:Histidine--tRNA ligase n=1 Tax=Clostridium sardiniense TaxID=29369 RepID=A0ABS7KWC1_CLOSR|nr:histidine--tRNA ligase [Clostridium sardiniense]MBY0755108.1 histidine--tRNA ligase [Clostridium sardiniense]MDQ0459034.1 histidyl-tRNA synthetase [Clostridium sardiniense]